MKRLPAFWDIIYLGTLGFAQVGEKAYEGKAAIERQVLTTYFMNSDELKVPEKFKAQAYFNWQLCPHDFGSYWDFQIAYDRETIDEWEDDEDSQELYEEFKDWTFKCEDEMGLNCDYLLSLCEDLYRKNITMDIIHKNIQDKNEGLKVV